MYIDIWTVAYTTIFLLLTLAVVYLVGVYLGKKKACDIYESDLDRGSRYIRAVSDFDLWCSYLHPSVKLISSHLRAVGEGTSLNSGTPVESEPCTVNGLRDQLTRRLIHSSSSTTAAKQISKRLAQLRTDVADHKGPRENRLGTGPTYTSIPKENALSHIDSAIIEIDKLLS